jgi:hypothetical protein
MKDVHFDIHGGSQIFHVNPPTQQELDLESISETITIRLRSKEKQYLEQLAKKRGVALSRMCRRIIFNHLKIEPKLREIQGVLDYIL